MNAIGSSEEVHNKFRYAWYGGEDADFIPQDLRTYSIWQSAINPPDADPAPWVQIQVVPITITGDFISYINIKK